MRYPAEPPAAGQKLVEEKLDFAATWRKRRVTSVVTDSRNRRIRCSESSEALLAQKESNGGSCFGWEKSVAEMQQNVDRLVEGNRKRLLPVNNRQDDWVVSSPVTAGKILAPSLSPDCKARGCRRRSLWMAREERSAAFGRRRPWRGC